MIIIELLGQVTAGLRLALALLAAMLLLARVRGAWRLIALSAVIYTPMHLAWLLGYPAPRVASITLDLACSAVACWAFIAALSEHAAQRGVSPDRVRRGARANVLLVIAIVAVAWLTR